MAISFDSAAQVGGSTTAHQTFSHTMGSGSNGIVIVTIQFGQSATISGVPTYAGNNMSLLTSYNFGGSTFKNTYLYYYVNPPAGTNTVSVYPSTTAYTYVNAASYFGVDQTNPFGSTPVYGHATPATGTSLSYSLTTNVDNAWLVGMAQAQNATISASTNTVGRGTLAPGAVDIWMLPIDTGAAQTPAGSHSMAVTTASSVLIGIIAAQLAPAAGTTYTPSPLNHILQMIG